MYDKPLDMVAFLESCPFTDDWKAGIEFRGLTEDEAEELRGMLLEFFEKGIQSLKGSTKNG